MKKALFLMLFGLVWLHEMAAQTAFFPYNLYRYNPAAISSQQWEVNAEYASRWMGIPGYIRLSDVNVQKRLPKLKAAVGLNVFNDNRGEGNLFRQNMNLSYARQWSLGSLGKNANSPSLALGVQSGVFYGVLARPSFVMDDYVGYYGPGLNLNTGIQLSLPDDKFYAGFSVSDIVQPRWYYRNLNMPLVSQPTSYQLLSGYRFRIGQKFALQPNVLLKMTSQYSDFYGNIQLRHPKWEAGLSYATVYFSPAHDYYSRTMAGVNMGLVLKKRFSLRYAYQMPLFTLTNKLTDGTHSFMLSYRGVK